MDKGPARGAERSIDERAALRLLAEKVPDAGDDAAVIGEQVLTTDMLHDRTDFPAGTTRYTEGWRSIGASLSDVAAMGASATAAVAAYAAPSFDVGELHAFVDGATAVCNAVGATYVGGDLDNYEEFTIASTALGQTDAPVRRSGAAPGEVVVVTGSLGRSGAALRLFDRGPTERANELFRFTPRIAAGEALAPDAGAMMDSSDGLARSLHQLAEASGCGFEIRWERVPVHPAVEDVATDEVDRRELTAFFGEDFELVATVPEARLGAVRDRSPTELTVIGTVTETDAGITADGEVLPDRGYTHGGE